MKHLILAAAAASVLAVGCQSKKQNNEVAVESRRLLNIETDSSNTLTDAAELVLSPNNYNVSHKLFSVAAKKDPNNFKAQFYLALFERIEIMRGLESRVQGLAKSLGFEQELAQYQGQAQLLSDLLTGDKNSGRYTINNVKDVQKLLLEYRNASVKFYKLLKANSQNTLLINIPLAAQSEGRTESCKVDSKGQSEYQVVCKGNVTQAIVLQAPDLVAMRLYAIMDALYISVPLAYNWSGLEGKIKKDEKLSFEDFKSRAKGTEFGKILYPEVLKIYRTVGADALQAMKWWRANADRFCSSSKNAKGEVVIEGPIVCNDDRKGLDGSITLLEKYMSDKIYFKESINYYPTHTGIPSKQEGSLNTKNEISFEVSDSQKERSYVAVANRQEADFVVQPLSLIETPIDNVFDLFAYQPERKCSEVSDKKDFVSLKDVAESMCKPGHETN